MNGQLCDQTHDRFVVTLHLGAVAFDGVLDNSMSWYKVLAAAGDGLGGDGGILWADEDRQILLAVAVAVVVVWDNIDTDTSCRAALAAQCAAVPSAVDRVVVAVGAYGVSAPMLCNKTARL